jgi:hypothetical protein
MKKLGPVLVAVAVFSLAGGTAHATHPRPQGATPITTSLVPAFKQCTAPNRTHGAPLAFPSCTPPGPTSLFLTVGTGDNNGALANSVGRARFDTVAGVPGPPEDSDMFIAMKMSDVRCRPATAGAVCPAPNTADGPDYTGELQLLATSRIIDHYNGSNLDEAATVVDIPLPVNATCAATADTSVGGTCSVTTTFNTVVPGAIRDSMRTVWQLGQVQILDGGADGKVSTSDNSLFAVEGVFVP